MSIRVDSSSLISGAVVVGVPGLGVLAGNIPTTGEHGGGIAATWLGPEDAGKEVRVLVTSWPAVGSLFVFEDTAFEYDGPSTSFEAQLYLDGVAVGTPQPVTITVGAGIAAAADQQIPAFSQSASSAALVAAQASQSVPAFQSSAQAAALVAAGAAQSVPAFGQSAQASLSDQRHVSASQQVPVFGQASAALAVASVTSEQQVPTFGQAALASAPARAAAAQTVPAFSSSAQASALVASSATQAVPAFDQVASASLSDSRYASASQQVPAFSSSAAGAVTVGIAARSATS